MSKCKTCGSYAINHHCHGRDGSDGDLCDVCYWRKRAEQQPPRQPMTDEQKDAARWRHMRRPGCDWWEILNRAGSDFDCDLDQAVDEAIERAHNIK